MNSEGIKTDILTNSIIRRQKGCKRHFHYKQLMVLQSIQFCLIAQYFIAATVLLKNFLIKEEYNIVYPFVSSALIPLPVTCKCNNAYQFFKRQHYQRKCVARIIKATHQFSAVIKSSFSRL